MSHDSTLRSKCGVTHRTLVRRILRTFDAATAADLAAGANWYGEAEALAVGLAERAGSVDAAAAVISHLSPRTTWGRNVAAAVALILEGPDAARAVGAIRANVDRASAALESADPLESFGSKALKTRAFASNIAGDVDAVTVDVWAARVVGITERELKLKGVYGAVADAYRAAARARGVDPRVMQATTWIVVRGGRAH